MTGSLLLASCSREEVSKLEINKSTYEISKEQVIQENSSFLDDGQIKIGLVSDLEGAIKECSESAKILEKENVDVVIIAGDVYENERIRRNPLFPNSTNNPVEMVNCIRPYSELGVPVFIIAGNHETRGDYFEGISKLEKNVISINSRSVDLHGVNIVGMGGYHHPSFIPKDGFLLGESDYKRAEDNLLKFQRQNEPTIFVTHGPPKSGTKIDYVRGVGHVGDKNISKILNNSDLDEIINVHGHIHEGGRNRDSYSSGSSINVASITPYNNSKGSNTGLLTFNEGKFSYKELN